MKIEDRVEKTEELTEVENNNLFTAIIRGKDITEVIHTSKGDFKIKFPRAKDIEAIGRLTAIRLNGIPAQCFDRSTYSLMQEIATLDILTISGPSWWELAKKDNSDFSWQDIPSQKFIQEVYALAYNFRTEIQDKIDENKERTDTELATAESSNGVDKQGLFSDISGKR